MGTELNFNTTNTHDNKTRFVLDDITITVDRYFEREGKHEIGTPAAATAHYSCMGKNYFVTNGNEVPTVEDWYAEELLPKFQMLRLLIADV